MSTSSSTTSARELFAKHGGMLRTRKAIRLGIHPRTLYALRDTGEIESIGRGLYRLASAPPLTAPDWVAIALRLPRAVIPAKAEIYSPACASGAISVHGQPWVPAFAAIGFTLLF